MKIVIIGAGLGGLECGYLLSKQGFEVCILEQSKQIGGCLQSFERKGHRFDTGFHYVGGMGEGEVLYRLFEDFNLLNLPWKELDRECFDEVYIDREKYSYVNGYENFAEELSRQFPNQREALHRYAAILKNAQEGLQDFSKMADNPTSRELMTTSAYNFLQQNFSDERLRNVLSATSLKMDLLADSLPFYLFAQINGTFIQSAWRLVGGGQVIADSLAAGIRSHGGEVRTRARVTGMQVDNERVSRVLINGEEEMTCDLVISDIHPNILFPLLPEGAVRKRYIQRIKNLHNSFGVFTVHLLLKENSVKYRNRNLFIHHQPELWRTVEQSVDGRTRSIGVHFSVPENGGEYTRNIDLFMPMYWQEVAAWSDSQPLRRPGDYEAFKQRRAEDAITQVLPYLPELKGNIEQIFTSTPLTYHDYTGTYEGSAYGICTDCNNLMVTILPTKTPLPNLFLTGQSINFHGVLAVTVTAKITCEQVIATLPTL
jgi:phytoene dehydrogenase-like protein